MIKKCLFCLAASPPELRQRGRGVQVSSWAHSYRGTEGARYADNMQFLPQDSWILMPVSWGSLEMGAHEARPRGQGLQGCCLFRPSHLQQSSLGVGAPANPGPSSSQQIQEGS